MMKLWAVLLVGAITCLHPCLGAQKNITDGFSDFLDSKLSNLAANNFTFPLPWLKIPTINITGYFVVDAKFKKPSFAGYKDLAARPSFYDAETTVVEMSMVLPDFKINTNEYVLNGTVFDSVYLHGDGGAWFELDTLVMTMRGNTSQVKWTDNDKVVVFKDAELDLDLKKWSLWLDNLNPESDLGTLANEFLMMLGPEIFEEMGIALTQSGFVLKLANSLFPPPN